MVVRRALTPSLLTGFLATACFAVASAQEAPLARVVGPPAPTLPDTIARDDQVWVFFDESNVYVSFRAWESQPERQIVNEMRRDSNNIRQGDSVEFAFDTFRDRRNAILFEANALGARLRWEFRPGSELFVVYNEEQDNAVRTGLQPLLNRTVIVKVNRFLRF